MSPDVRSATVPYSEYVANPYPLYKQVRESSPIYFDEHFNAWMLLRYADVQSASKDSRLSSAIYAQTAGQSPEFLKPLTDMLVKSMVFNDAPVHTRLRRLVHKAFTPAIVERLRDSITQIVHQRLDVALRQREFDLKTELAFPLPMTVISRLLDIPSKDQDRFHNWVQANLASAEPNPSLETLMRSVQGTVESNAYYEALIEERRAAPGDDLISKLIEAEEEGDQLTREEMVTLIGLLILAGYETTMNLICNGTLALLRNPQQWELLKAHPQLTKTAVEELLRYDTPSHFLSRVALEDLEIGGITIHKDERVELVLGSANHDPEQFTDPDVLDIQRADNKHISFGSGAHYCLGAPLARLEAQITFEILAQRLPSMQLVNPDPEFLPNLRMRSVTSLPIRVTP